MKKWQLCVVALVSLLTTFSCTAASQVLWKFDTGG